jgi:hypothetical protein
LQSKKLHCGIAVTAFCIIPFLSSQNNEGEDGTMHDKKQENGAAKMAWQLFEKTGSISYYMLYYDLIRRK